MARYPNAAIEKDIAANTIMPETPCPEEEREGGREEEQVREEESEWGREEGRDQVSEKESEKGEKEGGKKDRREQECGLGKKEGLWLEEEKTVGAMGS